MSTKSYKRGKIHKGLMELIHEEFLNHSAAGSRLPSVRKLALHYRVSAPTVRTALLALQQEGWVELRHGSHTLATGRAARRRVGLFTEADITHPLTSAYGMRLLYALRQFCLAQDFETAVYSGEAAPEVFPVEPTCFEFVDDVANKRLDGVLAISPPHPKWMEKLRADNIPVVGAFPGYDYFVKYDHAEMLRHGVRRLLDGGRKRIALMSWDEHSAPDVFRRVLSEAGVAVRERWIRAGVHPSFHGAGWEEFREIWSAYPDKPDGLLVADDVLFKDAIPAILGIGVPIPDELTIVAHANKGSVARLPFPVTLMLNDPVAHAEAMGGLLLRLMKQEPVPPRPIMLPFEWSENDLGDSFRTMEESGKVRTSNTIG